MRRLFALLAAGMVLVPGSALARVPAPASSPAPTPTRAAPAAPPVIGPIPRVVAPVAVRRQTVKVMVFFASNDGTGIPVGDRVELFIRCGTSEVVVPILVASSTLSVNVTLDGSRPCFGYFLQHNHLTSEIYWHYGDSPYAALAPTFWFTPSSGGDWPLAILLAWSGLSLPTGANVIDFNGLLGSA